MQKLYSSSLWVACFFMGIYGWSAAPSLPPSHVKAHVSCHDCHGEEAPTKAAESETSCVVCHGDLPAMAAYTKGLPVNPHAPPKGEHHAPLACTECHHQHKPPVVKCLECHPTFKLKAK